MEEKMGWEQVGLVRTSGVVWEKPQGTDWDSKHEEQWHKPAVSADSIQIALHGS